MVEEIKTTKLTHWLIAPNDRNIALMYFIFSCMTALVGITFSLIMRMELQEPGVQILTDARIYSILTTSHGLILIVFSLIPLLFCGFGHLILPKELGLKKTKFNPLSYTAFWLLLIAFSLLMISIYQSFNDQLVGGSGWTVYPPLSNKPFAKPAYYGVWALLLAYFSFFLTALNFLFIFITSRRTRTKFSEIPASCWAFLMAALLIIIVWTKGTVVYKSQIIDVLINIQIMQLNAIMGLHSIIFLSLLAVLCAGISTSTAWSMKQQRFVSIFITISGLIIIAARFLEVQFWNTKIKSIYFFPKSDLVMIVLLLLISVCLLKIMISAKPYRAIPLSWILITVLFMLFSYLVYYYIIIFEVNVLEVHDTYFYVAMEHLTIKIPAMFAFFAGWYAFFSKITGRSYFPILSILHLVSFFLGSLLTFVPQIQLGILGMPTRYIDYPNPFADLNFLSSIGSYIVFASLIFFVLALIFTKKQETNAQAK